MSYDKPLPTVTQDSEPYWRAARHGRLVLRHCRVCNNLMFYPRVVCTCCLSDDLDWQDASGRGTIYSVTACHRAPNQAFRAEIPYVIALIDLEEGPRMMSNVTDCAPDEAAIGAKVEVWFDVATDEIAIPKFRLARTPAS